MTAHAPTDSPEQVERYEDLRLQVIGHGGGHRLGLALFQREGLSRPRKRVHRSTPWTEPFAHARHPNDVWCMDFKGWFLTGESRGYRGAKFDRTRVRRSIEEGGLGAVQVTLRYDHLDLNSGTIAGGVQNGIQASLIWIPTDHVRFLINYGRLGYDDARIPAAGGDRDYAVNVFAARAQLDF